MFTGSSDSFTLTWLCITTSANESNNNKNYSNWSWGLKAST